MIIWHSSDEDKNSQSVLLFVTRWEKSVAEGGTRQKPGSRLAFELAFYSTLYWFLASA